jgi:hypothetical protein
MPTDIGLAHASADELLAMCRTNDDCLVLLRLLKRACGEPLRFELAAQFRDLEKHQKESIDG